MADENEVKALAERFYAVAVASEGTDYMTAWDAAQHAAREALRWRDETRPQQPAAAVPEDVARDAARYRWLRNDSGNAFDDPVIQGKYIGSPKVDWLTGEHADEAIDRAMLAAANKENGNG